MTSFKYILIVVALFSSASISVAQKRLSLHDALTLASNSNPDVKTSGFDVQKAEQQRVIARSLYLPTVTAGIQAYHYFQLPAFFGFGENGENGKIPYGRFGGDDQLSGAITAVQPIFNPAALPALHQSRIVHQQTSVAAKAKAIEVLSEVKQTYLRILVLNERIRLKQESITRNQRVLQDSRLLFLQGKGLRVDTLRAYTSVKNLEPDLIKLSYEAETSKLQLRTLIGIDSLEDILLIDSLTIPLEKNVPVESEVFEKVKNNNPEYQVVKLQSLVQKQQHRLAASQKLPVLSLIGQYQVQSQTNSLDYQNAYYPTSSFVGLQLGIPLFSGFGTNARIRQAALTKDQADIQADYSLEKLRARVHQVIARNKETLLRLDNTSMIQETAKLSYSIIQYRYKNGISPRLELTDAELALSTAQSNYLEAVYDYLTARIELRKLTGVSEIEVGD
jgi:outer membrane protein TolC